MRRSPVTRRRWPGGLRRVDRFPAGAHGRGRRGGRSPRTGSAGSLGAASRTRIPPGSRPIRRFDAAAAFVHRPATPHTRDADPCRRRRPRTSSSPAGDYALTVRYRNRETGMYAGAPFVDEWKPLTPRLHDQRTLERQRRGRPSRRRRRSRGRRRRVRRLRRGDGPPARHPGGPVPTGWTTRRPRLEATAPSRRWTSPTRAPTRHGRAPGCRPRTSGSSPRAGPASSGGDRRCGTSRRASTGTAEPVSSC